MCQSKVLKVGVLGMVFLMGLFTFHVYLVSVARQINRKYVLAFANIAAVLIYIVLMNAYF